jgi:hypothetical protein
MRRAVLPASRNRWITPVFTVMLVGLSLAAWTVARQAQTAVLESQSGSISAAALDPTATNFRAFTEPTPTGLVMHTAIVAGRPQLMGVTFMAAAANDQGGTVLTIPATFVHLGGTAEPLSELFTEVGFLAVVNEMESVLGIGFGEVVVLDARSWTSLMSVDLPLEFTLATDLFENISDEETRTILAAGTRQWDLAEVELIATHRNPQEASIGLARRQQEIWRSWISRTASSVEQPGIFSLDEGFIDLIGDLATGEVSYRNIAAAAAPADATEDTTYIADQQQVLDLVSQVVPFPTPAEPGDRPSVMLLDGTGGVYDQLPVLSAVVRSGGQVAILGNAERFDLPATEVQVHDPAAAEIAAALAERLGAGAPVEAPLTEATVSITVIVGADRAPAS